MRNPYPIRYGDRSDAVAQALSRPRRASKPSPVGRYTPPPPSPDQYERVSGRILQALTPREKP